MSTRLSGASALALLSMSVSVEANRILPTCRLHPHWDEKPLSKCDRIGVHCQRPGGGDGAGGRAAVAQGVADGDVLGVAELFDKIPAWRDLPDGAQLRNPPDNLKWLPTSFSSWRLEPDTLISYSCPDAPEDIEVCDAWLFYYTCAGCNDPNNGAAGGLAAMLALDPAWERVACAPEFTNGYSDALHPMKAFRRKLAPGATADVILPGVAEFLAFGLTGRGIDCAHADYNTALTCPTDEGQCKWEGDVCKNQNCGNGRGPVKGGGGCPAPCPAEAPLAAAGGGDP